MLIPIKPQDVTWTDAQWRAIFAEGRDILVSAAAGSGKTAVLIERLIQKMIREDNPIDVDELLVVTFTNASAAEMRHRMAEALEKALVKNPNSSHLRRQLSLLNKAQISTLHSFCLSIVKQYAYILDLDPGFRLANEAEAALIRDDVLAAILESAHKAENPEALYRLVDSFTTDRDDQMIETLIDKLYDTASVHPEPKKWLQSIPQSYNVPDDMVIDDLPFIGALKLTIQHAMEEAYAMTEEIRQYALLPAGPAPYGTTVEQDQLVIAEAIRRISTQSWQSTFDFFQTLKFATAARIPKDTFDDELVQKAKDKRDQLKKRVNGVKEAYFTRTPARLLQEMRMMHPLLVTLVELTLTYGDQYRLAKSERGLVDFSDLEHFALQILTEEEDGQLVPSSTAQDIMMQYKEVLVDEYQDTNRLQETILQIVKTGTEANGNMFMVGDVKQSIYRFRLAEPMLFLEKYLKFTTEPQNTGVKIDLNANFRSRAEVLDATNFIFSQIMGKRVGEIQYDEAAALKAGAPYPDQPSSVELTILSQQTEDVDEGASEDEEINEEILEIDELKKSQWEARYIIRKIRSLMDQKTMVVDAWTKKERPLEYRDIVILTRSMTWSADLTEEFKQAGIPLYANLSKGYFDALEVMIMLNTLRIVDNPYQDIPLASVLRAPFVGLTEAELSHIRLSAPKEPFYEALKNFVRMGGSGIASETAEKLQRFFLHYEEWRDLARRGSLADLIWRIYMDTHYYEMVGAMPGGKQRQANLRALHDRALSYEKSSFRGLFRFLRFIDRMKKRGDDLGTARAMSEKENVVRLMTIHSSKGLEFPYVFIAGLGRDFNQMDFNELYLFDQTFGLAVKAVDPDKRISFTSLPFLAMKEKKQLELKSEEMRVLYVAMTRAKEKLMLVATVKDAQKSIDKWQDISASSGDMLPEYVRSRAKGFLDWIGPAVARHHDFALWQGQVDSDALPHPSKWSFETIHVEELRQVIAIDTTSEPSDATKQKGISPEIMSEVERRFNTVYIHERSTVKRSKQSVSELKRIDQLRKEEEPEFFRTKEVQQAITSVHKRPAFLQQGEHKLTSAEIGTAMHTAMQHLDFNLHPGREMIESFIQLHADRQLLTTNEAKAIKVNAIENFLQSPLVDRLRHASEVLREVPFTYGMKDEDGDIQILQGIADCLFQEEDGQWVLLDYKTDRIKGVFHNETSILREMQHRYGLQLSLYQKAIENILSITIKEKILYLFDSNQIIVLED
ncbi:helicase-exonuclease AddAB, AddA subunit [Paenisporosarcina sp. HGH0030]|uniref:helicase-exonuclease AddAB subunit AddA n=1 Tax=Paenisporosarcina sp. HGH0030 TaxID=1078085 RepID=UPI00034E1AE9|nr:helicase-exonuclease AddAB subunit AddA [Paenisporosarcina sp. HGH0030]EPD52178.1 helicase-exonuclease AddAB, AddA subunit [Paenisporosarcina sp. HGH0030]